MNLDNLKKRLGSLEQRAVQALPMWPPKEGSFRFCLWDRLGRTGERREFMAMYMQRAAHFWKDAK